MDITARNLSDFLRKFAIWFVYQHRAGTIKDWRWSMKISKAINLFLDYHKMNSQKKYGPGLRVTLGQISGPFS